MLSFALTGLYAVLGLMFLGWVASVIKNDTSVVDILWGPACLLTGVVYFLQTPEPSLRSMLVLGLAFLWALRLALFVGIRNHGKPEDRRYAEMRERNGASWRWRSLVTVFVLQAVLAWIVSVPLLGIVGSPAELNLLDYLGLAIAVFGLAFETIADLQMAAFQSHEKNKGGVMNKGLWRYSPTKYKIRRSNSDAGCSDTNPCS